MHSLMSCIFPSVLKGPVQVQNPMINQITDQPLRTLWDFHLPQMILAMIQTTHHNIDNQYLLLSIHLTHPLLIELHHHHMALKGHTILLSPLKSGLNESTMFPTNQITYMVMTDTQWNK